MNKYHEGAFRYTFPREWKVFRLQTDEFYRRQFQGFNGGSKEVDFIALDGNDCLWLLEAKDFSNHPRSNPRDLAEEVADKVRDSLACLEAMQVSSLSNPGSRVAGEGLSKAQSCRVVLHLEMPTPGNLALSPIDSSNVRMRLRQLLRGIDSTALVADQSRLRDEIPITISRN